MADLISDGAKFSCKFCTSKLTLTVINSSSEGESNKLANITNCFFPPPGGNCTFPPGSPPKPCVGIPVGFVIDPGQSTVKIDNQPALSERCTFICPIAQQAGQSSSGQKIVKHNEAKGADDAISWAEVASIIAALGIFLISKRPSPGLARAAPLAKKAVNAAAKVGKKAVAAVKKIFSKPPDPRSSANMEKYKQQLRRQMEKPHVKDPELKDIMDYAYRKNAKIGSGSTADGIRHELATGEKIKGCNHFQKGQDILNSLSSWLKKNRNNPNVRPSDFDAAENVFLDTADALQNSLKG